MPFISLLVWLLIFLSLDARPKWNAAGGDDSGTWSAAGAFLAGRPPASGTGSGAVSRSDGGGSDGGGSDGGGGGGGGGGGANPATHGRRTGEEGQPPVTAAALLPDWTLATANPTAADSDRELIGIDLPAWVIGRAATEYAPTAPGGAPGSLLAPTPASSALSPPAADPVAAPLPGAAWGGVVLIGGVAARRFWRRRRTPAPCSRRPRSWRP